MDVIAIARVRRRELNRSSNDGPRATKATHHLRSRLSADTHDAAAGVDWSKAIGPDCLNRNETPLVELRTYLVLRTGTPRLFRICGRKNLPFGLGQPSSEKSAADSFNDACRLKMGSNAPAASSSSLEPLT
jgi:hypothetical protein